MAGSARSAFAGAAWSISWPNACRSLSLAFPFMASRPTSPVSAEIKARDAVSFRGRRRAGRCDWPPYEAALKAAGVRYEAFIYPRVQHGFNNDTTPRFDAAAAKLAWGRATEFFRRTLVG